ncbi:MAG: patatin-like phospholipase family protein [Betaproteobacteria bacterium]|nr:patatin-like phospholipase family protein [Betaproteobacteria bacterium]
MKVRHAVRAAVAVFVFLVAGCLGDSGRLDGPDAPRFVKPSREPRLAVVLGSGGPRGFAHIGALLALEEAGIRPDLVVGSSAGALVGALYASGKSPGELQSLARDVNVLEFFEVRMVTGGLATGRALQDYVNRHVEGRPIESFPMAFAAVAAIDGTSRPVVLNAGNAGGAVRASSASPGQFEPVRIGGEALVDGDEASPVPIRVARQLGAKVVIAVDVSAYLATTPPGAPAEWVRKDERRAAQVRAEADEADVLVHPDIGYYAGHTAEYRQRVIAVAAAATRAKLPEIRAAIARAGAAQSSRAASMPAAETAR